MSKSSRFLKVFICHASQDKPVIRELAQRLSNEGWIDPWLDEKKLLPGQDWQSQIEEAVETSNIVIICLSNHSINKEGYLQKELRFAREIALEKPEGTVYLIPLRLDDCLVPRGLRFYQWGDYFGKNKEETYEMLLESLKLRHEQKLKVEDEEQARQDVELESARKVLPQEKNLETSKKPKHAQSKRRIAHTVLLREMLFKLVSTIKLPSLKIRSFFRIVVVVLIGLVSVWFIGTITNFLITPTQANIIPSLSTPNTFITSPVSFTQTTEPSLTPTRNPAIDYLKGTEILFTTGDGTLYSFSNQTYSKLGVISAPNSGDWSWNSNKDFFISGTTSDDDVYFIDRTGQVISSLNIPYLNYCPDLSPNGKKILVKSQATNRTSLWVLNIDGSGFRRLTLSNQGFGCPAWSPDGEFISAEGGSGIVIMDLTGLIIQEFETFEIWSRPKWSPNGKSLLLCHIYDGIALLNIEENIQEQLLSDSVVDCDWSPNGNHIVYASPTGLEILDINTRVVTNLVKMINITKVAWK